jgi:hypothetical protein
VSAGAAVLENPRTCVLRAGPLTPASAALLGACEPSRGLHGEAPGRAGRRAREGRSARPHASGTRALADRARGAARGGRCSAHQLTRRPSTLLAALPSVVRSARRRPPRGDPHARRGHLRRRALARCEPVMSASRDLCGAPSRAPRAPLPANLARRSAHENGPLPPTCETWGAEEKCAATRT